MHSLTGGPGRFLSSKRHQPLPPVCSQAAHSAHAAGPSSNDTAAFGDVPEAKSADPRARCGVTFPGWSDTSQPARLSQGPCRLSRPPRARLQLSCRVLCLASAPAAHHRQEARQCDCRRTRLAFPGWSDTSQPAKVGQGLWRVSRPPHVPLQLYRRVVYTAFAPAAYHRRQSRQCNCR